MSYNFIIFDADETLLDFSKVEEYAFKKSMKYFNIEYEKDLYYKYYKKINKHIWREFEEEQISSEDLKTERFKRFFKKFNINLDPNKVSEKYIENMCRVDFILDGAIEILEQLKGKFKLALITNGFLEVQCKRLKHSSISKYFDTIVISEEIGFAKPNPKIFEYTFKKANYYNKKTSLIVGDNLNSDIKGGINFGIDTCWFNSRKLKNNSNIIPTYEINHLIELKYILKL